MQREIVVRGRMMSPTAVELAEPVPELAGEVEVVLRAIEDGPVEESETIFEFIRRLPAGTRTKEEIDRQLQDEHGALG